MIEIKNLKKKYGKFVAIEDFNLQIEEGKSYGILARINSGGTTIFNLLCNYILKDQGDILIDGKEPKDARNLIYMCPKIEFYEGYTFREILKFITEFNEDFDLLYAMELCKSFKIELDKKFKVDENIKNCNIFKTIVTICMKRKYLLFNKPDIGLSNLEIRKLSDILLANVKKIGYTPIIHSKNFNYFFDNVDYIIILKDKKVVLFESRKKLQNMVYSISGSLDVINSAINSKDVLAVRTVKNFSKLKIAYILAKDEDELKAHGNKKVSIKEIYEAITIG